MSLVEEVAVAKRLDIVEGSATGTVSFYMASCHNRSKPRVFEIRPDNLCVPVVGYFIFLKTFLN